MRLIWIVLSASLLANAACGDNVQPAAPDAGFEPWLLDELTAEQGFWIRTPTFDVPAGTEIQDCYFFEVPDLDGGEDLWVDRLQLALNAGSHHMNVFRVNTVYDLDPADGAPVDMGSVDGTLIPGGECWKGPNWRDWPLVGNSQQGSAEDPIVDWTLPDGVAQRFAPGETLMLQIHFVNATTQVTPYQGRGGINFHRSTDGDTIELGTLFATQQSIRICQSNPVPVFTGACGMPAETSHTVVAANGHFHSRGRAFGMYAWDGVSTDQPGVDARFYQSENWAEPEMAIDLDVELPTSGGVWWRCQYQWEEPTVGCDAINAADPQQAGDCCYTFGGNVETGEHCNAFVYYFPKENRGDITCF